MPNFTSTPAKSAAAFVQSIGINADVTDPETARTIADRLQYLGIGHLRTDYARASDVLIAGSKGAKVDEIVPHYMYAVTTKEIQNFLSQNIDPAASVIEAVEGPNEVQNDTDSYNGVSGPAGIQAMQRELYTLTKADTTLNNPSRTTSVFNFSVLQGTPQGNYGGMQNYADFGNVHAYAGSGIPAIWMLPYEVTHNDIAGSDPIVVTETGATTISSSPGVTEDMQARWDISALLDAYSLGITRTYLYNLTDWSNEPGQSGNFSAHYGLYTANGTPKLAATAIHNMTSLLSSGGLAPASASISYSLEGMKHYSQSELFAKANGVFDLALWNEAYYWNPTTGTESDLTANDLTVTFTKVYGRIDVYDPLVSALPVQSATNASSIAVALGKDPLFIEITPIGTSSIPASAPTLDTTPPALTVTESVSGLTTPAPDTAAPNTPAPNTTAPSLTVMQAVSGTTTQTSNILSGTVSDRGGGVAAVEIFINSAGTSIDLGSATLNGSNWTYAISNLAPGTYNFFAVGFDKAGHTTATISTGAAQTVVAPAPTPTPTPAPTPISTRPAIASITSANNTFVIKGTAQANTKVVLTDTPAAAQPKAAGFTAAGSDGSWTISTQTLSTNTVNTLSASTTPGGGTAGAFIVASTAADTLRGTAGQSDVFAFPRVYGKDIIQGFETTAAVGSSHDVINLSGTSYTSFAQLKPLISGTAAAVIRFDSTTSITLPGVGTNSLQASDFRFS